MPIVFDIDRERNRIQTVAEGPITYPDVEEHISGEHGVSGLQFTELIDARRAVPKLSSGDVRQIAGLLRGLRLDFRLGPTAVLVPSDYAFGLLSMLAMFVADVCDVRPFRDEKEARMWLGWEPSENESSQT
jgi:hypothetical protein